MLLSLNGRGMQVVADMSRIPANLLLGNFYGDAPILSICKPRPQLCRPVVRLSGQTSTGGKAAPEQRWAGRAGPKVDVKTAGATNEGHSPHVKGQEDSVKVLKAAPWSSRSP